MRQIELVPGVSSSVLGFGCAPILGAVDGQTATAALHCALDLGINHFDLARSYGYGQAEAFVGRALKHRRSSIRLATKFGIQANWKASALRPLKPLVRFVRRSRSGSASRAEHNPDSGVSVADRFHDRIPIDPVHMQRSLETSLKALQTDYVDYFFIHEPSTTIPNVEDVLSAASKLKTQGKIRAFGLASPSLSDSVHAAYLDRFDILQFANSPNSENYPEVLLQRSSEPNVFFSPFRGGGVLSPAETLHRIADDFHSSVILCSMFNCKHIELNVAALNG